MTKGGEVNANVSPFLLGVALCGTEQIEDSYFSGSSLGSPEDDRRNWGRYRGQFP